MANKTAWQDNRQFEIIAMQALLPGLKFAVQRAVDVLNEANSALGLELARIETEPKRGRRAGSSAPPQPRAATAEAGEPKTARAARKAAAPKRRVMSEAAKAGLIAATKRRWDVVKEAGMDSGGHLPSKALVARAEKILARRKSQKGSKNE